MYRRYDQRRIGAFFTLSFLSAGSRLCSQFGLLDQFTSSTPAADSGIRLSLPIDVIYGSGTSGMVVVQDQSGLVLDTFALSKVEDQTSGAIKLVVAR